MPVPVVDLKRRISDIYTKSSSPKPINSSRTAGRSCSRSPKKTRRAVNTRVLCVGRRSGQADTCLEKIAVSGHVFSPGCGGASSALRCGWTNRWGDIPQNKHGNYYYIVPVVGRVVDKQFDPVSRCEEGSGRRGEVPDVETVVLPKSAEETRLWWCRLVFGRFKGLVDPQLHR